MTFKVFYDVAHEGYAAWWFPAGWLIFICIGSLLVFKPTWMLKTMLESMPFRLQGRAGRLFSWFFFVFAILWTLVSFLGTDVQYMAATNALSAGRYSIVEGPVTHFVPMPYSDHSEESFAVGGQKFSYSDYILTAGFHNTASHGGPIREGLKVRVTYVGNIILKLEIAESR